MASLREIQAAISSRAQLPGESVTVEERQVPVVPKLTGGANKKMRSLSSRVKVWRLFLRDGLRFHILCLETRHHFLCGLG